MPRPMLFRRVRFNPPITYFKPAGVKLAELKETVLTFGELEALRLCDAEEMDQKNAAKKMNLSQPTLHRTLLSARKKVADAVVNGKSIKIEGGNYKMVAPGRGLGRGQGMGRRMGVGRGLRRGMAPGTGRGRMGGTAGGPMGDCRCPKCNYRVAHKPSVPCVKRKCPRCGTMMVRA
ncbi:DUF134 domain-containing protein [Candidatus Woesearchaeota archaeon]|nr:DUF134 domain-containing protein [Candidatus Woesearchaeota archaeon]